MPAYQYQCTECHESFQVRKSIAEIDTQTFCPECGSPRTERLISNVTFFSSTDGGRRVIAGAPSCAGCGAVGTGCASCHPR
ncbi:MAG: zinc ribbon domain-containing protein [Anaerolineae bacterium]|nr:zinc ribbon domain-containing protein [Anaerolineae bacterium]